MAWSTIRRIYNLLHPPKALNCPASLWKTVLGELRERGGGVRESGGLLLGTVVGDRRFVSAFVAYDDVDPNALQGIIMFDASKMDSVWARCEAEGLEVVADVHTHPGGFGQSRTDKANPIIPQRGHLALIVPNYADRAYRPGQFGIYEFRGRDGWLDHSARGGRFMRLGWLS